jgi:hypothetical protein
MEDEMKRQRMTAARRGEGLADLDALVRAELDSLDRADAKEPPKRASDTAGRRPGTAAHPDQRGAPAPVTPLRPAEAVDPTRSGEEFDGLAGDEPIAASRGLGQDEGDASSLFSVEEEAFITRAVSFLTDRRHADVILGRVWEQLTELDPDGFFAPPENTAAESGSAEADAAHPVDGGGAS